MVEFPDSSANMGTSASWFLVLGDYVLVGWWIWAGNVKVFGIISGRDNPKTEVLLWHNQFDQAAIVLNQKKQIRDITIKYQVLGKYFFTVYLLKPQTIQIFKDEQLIMWFIRGEKKRKPLFSILIFVYPVHVLSSWHMIIFDCVPTNSLITAPPTGLIDEQQHLIDKTNTYQTFLLLSNAHQHRLFQ